MSEGNTIQGLSSALLGANLNTTATNNDDAAAAQNASRVTIDIKQPLIPSSVLRVLYEKGVALEHQIGNEFTEFKEPLGFPYDDRIQGNIRQRGEIRTHLETSRHNGANRYVTSERPVSTANTFTDRKTGETFKLNELGYEETVKFIIDNRVSNGRYELTPGGQIKDTSTNTVFEDGSVGFQLQTFVISRLQDQIKEINELISRLTLLNDWVTQNQITKDNSDQIWHVNLKGNSEGRYTDFMVNNGFGSQEARRKFMINTNNDFVKWLGITKFAKQVDGNAVFGDGRFGSGEDKARVSSTSFTNATERMRNLVKEKSTQAEQLGTDFQTRNSRYNAVIEAMTNYTKSYFGAVKNFVS